MIAQDIQILQLSDLHLRGDGTLSFQVVDTRTWLDHAAAHLRSLIRKPDAIVITGDLADSGDEHAYHMVREALTPLGVPVYAVPGNHDRRDRMRSILGDWCPAEEAMAPYLCFGVSIGETRLIMMDSMAPGSHSGHTPPAVTDFLRRELQALNGQHPLVFLHHPPFLSGLGAMDEPFEAAETFEAVLRDFPNVRLCCGHLHRPLMTQWAGCLALTAPSVSMQIDLDLSPEGGDTFRMETPGYMLHHWNGYVWNSHVCQIPCAPTFSGPHPFVGSVNPHEAE